MEDICSICHEDMTTDLYTLPECSHLFHTNCIMHWWRTGHNKCPLCNNPGVNGSHNPILENQWGSMYLRDMENYKRLRRHSRKNTAPQFLKIQVQKIKKIEEIIKNIRKNFREWKKLSSSNMTNQQIVKQGHVYRKRIWKNQSKLRRQKRALGASETVIPIIIATKVTLCP